ncbi:MAG: beta-ketoacyl synthase [Desulfobulbaceae bacterium]|nr:beta-ketoacyl synthase [Desulfobulbaceae bacterium]
MRKVVVVDGDILTPLGNLQTTWDNLLAGKSGIVRQGFGSMKGQWPLGIIPDTGNDGSWKRLHVIFDRLFKSLPVLPEKTELICATTKAAVDEYLVKDGEHHKGQPWQVVDLLARQLSLTGSAATVSAACASGTLAVIQGAMKISAGECDHVLVVGFDLVGEFILAGFDSLKALSAGGARPFDYNRDGLSLGDGAGWLLLSTEKKEGVSGSPLAHLESWGISCDATHITAPCRKASGLIEVFDQIIGTSNVPIGGINAHGTGTIYNDTMELRAFTKKCEAGTPVCSTKGALGHSLGATGVIEALLSSLSLQHNVLPPTVGLKTPEESSCLLSGTQPLTLLHPSVVTCNSGFGGINAALFMTR